MCGLNSYAVGQGPVSVVCNSSQQQHLYLHVDGCERRLAAYLAQPLRCISHLICTKYILLRCSIIVRYLAQITTSSILPVIPKCVQSSHVKHVGRSARSTPTTAHWSYTFEMVYCQHITEFPLAVCTNLAEKFTVVPVTRRHISQGRPSIIVPVASLRTSAGQFFTRSSLCCVFLSSPIHKWDGYAFRSCVWPPSSAVPFLFRTLLVVVRCRYKYQVGIFGNEKEPLRTFPTFCPNIDI